MKLISQIWELHTEIQVGHNPDFFQRNIFDLCIYIYLGYDKPNSTANASPESRVWLPTLKRFFRSRTNENVFLALLNMERDAVHLYGSFEEIWLTYTFVDETTLKLEWLGLNKTPTRLGEASMIKFLLPMEPACSLIQYDTKVDVQQAAGKTSYYQRGVDAFSCQTSLSAKCFITLYVKSYDTPLGRLKIARIF